MQRLAEKIITLIDDVRMTNHDLDALAWNLINLSPQPMQKRLAILAENITYYNARYQEKYNDNYTQDSLF